MFRENFCKNKYSQKKDTFFIKYVNSTFSLIHFESESESELIVLHIFKSQRIMINHCSYVDPYQTPGAFTGRRYLRKLHNPLRTPRF